MGRSLAGNSFDRAGGYLTRGRAIFTRQPGPLPESDTLRGRGFDMSPALATKPSAAGWLRLLIVLGLLAALAIAAAVALIETFSASRNCHGGFNSGFGAGFDTYRCEIIVRFVRLGNQIMIPLP
jgi:hypothetical protein